jgi:hypothetical protein
VYVSNNRGALRGAKRTFSPGGSFEGADIFRECIRMNIFIKVFVAK